MKKYLRLTSNYNIINIHFGKGKIHCIGEVHYLCEISYIITKQNHFKALDDHCLKGNQKELTSIQKYFTFKSIVFAIGAVEGLCTKTLFAKWGESQYSGKKELSHLRIGSLSITK